MNLYERDYSRILLESEQKLQDTFKEYENIKGMKSTRKDPRYSCPEFEGRKFLWCYNSLFPNNYLYHREPSTLDLEAESKRFIDIIYKAQNESEIQSYIKSGLFQLQYIKSIILDIMELIYFQSFRWEVNM